MGALEAYLDAEREDLIYDYRNQRDQAWQENANLRQQLANLRQQLANTQQELADTQQELQDAKEEIQDCDKTLHKWIVHEAALRRQRDVLMGELDKIHGGRDKNIFRQPFHEVSPYDDPPQYIPGGPDKGKIASFIDMVYIAKYKKVFERRYAKDYKENWEQFMHKRIRIQEIE